MNGQAITAEPVIRFDAVTKQYRRGGETIHALGNVTFSIGRGEFVVLTGPSGSGKSTLLHIAAAFDDPDDGSVTVGGADTCGLDDRARAALRGECIGFVFQFFNLAPTLDCIENVALPLVLNGWSNRAARRRAEALLVGFGLGTRLRHRPEELSGGQQQRVAVARALAPEPLIILADEPTGNLDSEHGLTIIEALRGAAESGTSVLMATHDPRLLDGTARRIALHDGHLMASVTT